MLAHVSPACPAARTRPASWTTATRSERLTASVCVSARPPLQHGQSRKMSHNTYGHLFRVTTWGESHGPAIGCVVDGCPPGLSLTPEFIQQYLDRRKPGTSRFVTQRQEEDKVR